MAAIGRGDGVAAGAEIDTVNSAPRTIAIVERVIIAAASQNLNKELRALKAVSQSLGIC
jgi:hypothetical protein